ncbi:MAG: hypothetical protein ACR2PU_00220, partial [Gammaproteobacteria bacterium]
GSHFSGGWKVPLSLAASVVLVFALLIQLDQSSEQLDMPPMPSIEADAESTPGNKTSNSDFNEPADEIITSDHDIAIEAKESSAHPETQKPSSVVQDKLESRKKLESQGSMSRSESSLEKSRQFDDSRLNNELEKKQASKELLEQSPSISSPSAKPKASIPEAESPKSNRTLDRKQDAQSEQKQSKIQEGSRSTNGAAAEVISPESSMDLESNRTQQTQEPMKRKKEDGANFAPIPVEDWLLMIEKLIANKDYAEAARQLEKFKHAHPKVNVEDLESKLP